MMGEPEGYRDSYERTSEALHRIVGLARALYDLSVDAPYLGSSEPTANGIISIMAVLEERAQQAGELHEAEWALIVRREVATQETST